MSSVQGKQFICPPFFISIILNLKQITMKVLLDITDSKAELAMEFLKSISFVKKVKAIAPNEITNASILQSIEAYEKGKTKPTPVNLKELKAIVNA
jgi:hypothetical protein